VYIHFPYANIILGTYSFQDARATATVASMARNMREEREHGQAHHHLAGGSLPFTANEGISGTSGVVGIGDEMKSAMLGNGYNSSSGSNDSSADDKLGTNVNEIGGNTLLSSSPNSQKKISSRTALFAKSLQARVGVRVEYLFEKGYFYFISFYFILSYFPFCVDSRTQNF